jgi:DNA polymerase
MRLHLDFETRGESDLEEVGLDNYARHPSTEILMLGWAVDDSEAELWEPHRSAFPSHLKTLVEDPSVIKCAWNATFERAMFLWKLGIQIPYQQMCDPMIWARHLSMPGSLEDCGAIMKVMKTEAKMEEGDRLKKIFSFPYKQVFISPLFGTSTAFFRNWETDPKEWDLFGEYCKQDVRAERAILKRMTKFPLPEIEQRGWVLDQKINDNGMPVDLDLVNGALTIAKKEQDVLTRQLQEMTGLENPNSRDQILEWLRKEGYPFNSMDKEAVARALSASYIGQLTATGKEALYIRQKASKTSYKKYEAILLNVGPDRRLRQQFSFLGASRAGRWTGHSVQLHNLPRPAKSVEKKMERAVELLRAHDGITLASEFPSVMDVVTSCVRASFRAPEGKKLVVCDLNAIENRGLGWVAKSKTILDVFKQGRCPYLDFACDLYHKDYEELADAYAHGDAATKEMRQISKPAVLGCGYGLGGGDEYMTEDGDVLKGGLWGYAENMFVFISKKQAHEMVKVWRKKNKEIAGWTDKNEIRHPGLWERLETAAIRSIKECRPQTVGPVTFECFGGKVLRILLPSGRGLHYIHPRIAERKFPGWEGKEPYVKESLFYEGIDQTTRQWVEIPTYGGKLTENIVQAIARDILLNGLFLAEEKGFEIAGHCHDEIITVTDTLGLVDLRECMEAVPPWAPDIPLGADGYEGVYYRKG